MPHQTEMLVKFWNEVVTPDDEVIINGDLVMGSRVDNLEHVKRLNGRKLLRSGNHDYTHAMHGAKFDKWDAVYEAAGLELLPEQGEMTVDGVDITLCHFPYAGEGSDHTGEERYSAFRPTDNGGLLVCGHVHDLWKINGRQINVGVDVWGYRPVPLSLVVQTLVDAQ